MPGLVRERVPADDGLVHLHALTGQTGHHLARRINLLVHDADRVREPVAADVKRHHDLFERGIARTLADAVDRALHLTRTALHRGDRVRHREPEIVVAVRAEHDAGGVRHALADRA